MKSRLNENPLKNTVAFFRRRRRCAHYSADKLIRVQHIGNHITRPSTPVYKIL